MAVRRDGGSAGWRFGGDWWLVVVFRQLGLQQPLAGQSIADAAR